MKYFNKNLIFTVLLLATSTLNYGLDNQAFATTQAMEAFTRQFGVLNRKGKYVLDETWLSLFSGLIYLGFGVGVVVGSLMNKRFGRRVTLFVLNAFEVITATIIITSKARNQLLAGRILNYIYIGMSLSAVPVFQAEIVPPQIRGLVVGTFHLALIFGGLIINCVCLGTSDLKDNRAFLIPYGLFYIVPAIVLPATFLIPESPRWLLLKDRHDEALVHLRRLRLGAYSEEEIIQEFETLRVALAAETEQGSFPELFHRANIRRTLIAMGMHWFENTCGQQLVAKFGSLLVQALGSVNPFVMTVVFAVANLIFTFIGMVLSDRVGRRPLLLISAFVQMSTCLVLGGIGSTGWPLAKPYPTVGVIMLVVLTSGFSLGFAPLANVITTEVTALRLRDMTQMVGSFMNVVSNVFVGIATPYMLTPLHSQIGWVFAPFGFLAFWFVFFFIPDCKGKSLEEIDWLFHNNIPIREFGSYNVPDIYAEHAAKIQDAAASGPRARFEDA